MDFKMKKRGLVFTLMTLSINAQAYGENLQCFDRNNSSLSYSVQQISPSDKYLLTVTKRSKIIYTETLKYLDWQGEAEYSGPYSTIINNGDEYIEFITNSSKLKSTQLICEEL